MKRIFLFLLLLVPVFAKADVVTFYVTSRNSLRVEGTMAGAAVASFSQTATSGKIGQMTMGNCTYFSLRNLPNIVITDITVSMHSNASSGAGELLMTHNNKKIASIDDSSFASEYWNGSFSQNSTPVSVPLPNQQLTVNTGDSIRIAICASASSLYVTSYTITYRPANLLPYNVHFSVGNMHEICSIRETQPNAGIVLPEMPEEYDEFSFIGWVEQPLLSDTVLPKYMLPGQIYYPLRDVTLYALFRDNHFKTQPWVQATDFTSGYYLFASTYEHCLALGGLNSKRRIDALQVEPWVYTEDSLRSMLIDSIPDEAVYYIEFLPDSTALITNVSANEVIGYSTSSSLNLTHNSDPWNYTVSPDYQITFFHRYSGNTRYLWATSGETLETIDLITFAAQVYIYNNYSNLLFNKEDAPEPVNAVYTSFAIPTAVDNTVADDIAITDRTICNPQGHLVMLFSPLGQLIVSSNSHIISLNSLTSGVYLLRCGSLAKKLFLR